MTKKDEGCLVIDTSLHSKDIKLSGQRRIVRSLFNKVINSLNHVSIAGFVCVDDGTE